MMYRPSNQRPTAKPTLLGSFSSYGNGASNSVNTPSTHTMFGFSAIPPPKPRASILTSCPEANRSSIGLAGPGRVRSCLDDGAHDVSMLAL